MRSLIPRGPFSSLIGHDHLREDIRCRLVALHGLNVSTYARLGLITLGIPQVIAIGTEIDEDLLEEEVQASSDPVTKAIIFRTLAFWNTAIGNFSKRPVNSSKQIRCYLRSIQHLLLCYKCHWDTVAIS